MSKNHRQYIETALARVEEERRHGATLDDVPRLLEQYKSPDGSVRARALRQSCPCHVSWEVYERVRKDALRLRKDPSPEVRAIANHLEEDARVLLSMEAALARYIDGEEEAMERRARDAGRPISRATRRVR